MFGEYGNASCCYFKNDVNQIIIFFFFARFNDINF